MNELNGTPMGGGFYRTVNYLMCEALYRIIFIRFCILSSVTTMLSVREIYPHV